MSLKFEFARDYAQIEGFAATESPDAPISDLHPSDDLVREVDAAYDAIFAALSPYKVTESGTSQPGALSMSRYVEPSHCIGVVIRDSSIDLRGAIAAAHEALRSIPTRFSIIFDDYPTSVCLSRDGRVLGYDADQLFDRLLPYGFPERIG